MLRANGIDPHGLSLEDAQDAVSMLVAMRRAIPAHMWVDHLVAEVHEREEASLPHNLI